MFAVKTESLGQAHGELIKMYSCMDGVLEEINTTRRRLMENTDMEIPLKELAALRNRLESQVLQIGRMARALERIAGIYQRTETKAADHLENPRPAPKRHVFVNNDLSSVRETLADIKLI